MEKDIGKITKNETTEVVIRIDDFGGNRGLTIREFVTSDRYTGFTKAGVRIKAADFPKFKQMINSISEKEMKEEVSAKENTNDEDSDEVSAEKPGQSEDLPDY